MFESRCLPSPRKSALHPGKLQVRRSGLVVHHAQRSVVQRVDAVGDARELHAKGAARRREIESVCHFPLQPRDRETVVRRIVGASTPPRR